MSHEKIVDHLFRHQYGKMVSILTNIFGLSHLELIEDAVQDTFSQALLKWRYNIPENPEAWLTKAARNRAIDLLRKIKAENQRFEKVNNGAIVINMEDFFLDQEIADAQLRMIFVACHPRLDSREQIAFALKTISGFSTKEIAAALLLKEETIKKRLSRARKKIVNENIHFKIPYEKELGQRLCRVMEVIYLTFNEGFHSTNPSNIVRKDLCGEALRLCQLLLKKETFRSPDLYALFALLCFHMARADSKINENQELIDLKNQDRSKWYKPLINLGNNAMHKAVESKVYTSYHYEAAIAGEHVLAPSFQETNWSRIDHYYTELLKIYETPTSKLNAAVVKMELQDFTKAKILLDEISPDSLEQRNYLYYTTLAEWYNRQELHSMALQQLNIALNNVSNEKEHFFIRKKIELIRS